MGKVTLIAAVVMTVVMVLGAGAEQAKAQDQEKMAETEVDAAGEDVIELLQDVPMSHAGHTASDRRIVHVCRATVRCRNGKVIKCTRPICLLARFCARRTCW